MTIFVAHMHRSDPGCDQLHMTIIHGFSNLGNYSRVMDLSISHVKQNSWSNCRNISKKDASLVISSFTTGKRIGNLGTGLWPDVRYYMEKWQNSRQKAMILTITGNCETFTSGDLRLAIQMHQPGTKCRPKLRSDVLYQRQTIRTFSEEEMRGRTCQSVPQ